MATISYDGGLPVASMQVIPNRGLGPLNSKFGANGPEAGHSQIHPWLIEEVHRVHAVTHYPTQTRLILKPLLPSWRPQEEHGRSMRKIMNLELLLLVHRAHRSQLEQPLLRVRKRHAWCG